MLQAILHRNSKLTLDLHRQVGMEGALSSIQKNSAHIFLGTT